MRKLTRTMVRPYALKLLQEQGGLCPLCGKPINPTIPKELVLDHDHTTGQVRGVLHRSCNAAEGKVANAAGRWGAKSMDYTAILPWLKGMVQYLEQPAKEILYPTFQTEDEKRIARNAKERRQRAERKARQVVRTRNATDKSSD